MINLLPPATQKNLIYARRNTTLRSWLIILTISLIVTVLVILGSLFYFKQTTKSIEEKVAGSQQQLKDQKIDETRQSLVGISNNVKLTIDVLSREILFSRLLERMAQIIPSNAVLSNLTINQLEGGLTIQIDATDIESATQAQVNLSDPKNGIFSKADLETITCEDSRETEYKCTASIKVLFSDDNPFSYISTNKGGAKQ